MTRLVFLHIPKTAGQTVHHQICSVIGETNTSPIRLHSQAPSDQHFPSGYGFYSGHLDWLHLSDVPEPRFVFTILRDPRERIASLYFFLRREAESTCPQDLQKPQFTGRKMILSQSADDYFFGGDPAWQRFIRDHYDNFYCTYFATRKMRGSKDLDGLTSEQILEKAEAASQDIDAVYAVSDLSALESDLFNLLGKRVSLVGNRQNTAPEPPQVKRWPKLLDRFEDDASRARLEKMAILDDALLPRLRFR